MQGGCIRRCGFPPEAFQRTPGETSRSLSLENDRLSAPGEFTGLQLVAMMYVGLKRIAPEADPGIDFSKDYLNPQLLK